MRLAPGSRWYQRAILHTVVGAGCGGVVERCASWLEHSLMLRTEKTGLQVVAAAAQQLSP